MIAVTSWAPVPSGNEFIYLLTPLRRARPEFLAYDWSFGGAFQENAVYNAVFGPLMLLLPPEAVGWVGRFVGWMFALWALFRLGRRMELGPAVLALCVVCWLGAGQSLVGGEWIFGGVEAKTFSYGLLFLAIERLIAGDELASAALLGACVSVHAAVGTSAALALGASMLVRRPGALRLASYVGLSAVIALPGLWPILAQMGGGSFGDESGWRFLTLVTQGHHLHGLGFPKRLLLLLYLLLAFGLLEWVRGRGDRVLDVLVPFLSVLGAITVFGLVAEAAGRYSWLKLFPFRLFPLLMPLVFLLLVARMVLRWPSQPPSPLSVGLALVGLIGLPGTVDGLVDKAGLARAQWNDSEELEPAMSWIREHLPADATVVLPPWRKDGFWRTQRAQVASLGFPRYDRLDEWRVRVHDLAGDLPEAQGTETTLAAARAHYLALSGEAMRGVAERYGAKYILTKAPYEFPVLHEAGGWRVYVLLSGEAR